MPPAISLFTNSFNGFVESPVEIHGAESWFVDFKKDVLKKQETTTPINSLVTNSSLYFTQWGVANAANAAFNGLDSYDKDTAQAVGSIFVAMAVVIDVLSTQNGYAAITQRNKCLESLRKLTTEVQRGKLTGLELTEMMVRCAADLQAGQALPGWVEFTAKIGTDAVAGINTLVQQVNSYITLAATRSAAGELDEVLSHQQDNLLDIKKTDDLINPKEASDTHASTEKMEESPAGAEGPSDLAIATNGIGIITGAANIVRGITEMVRVRHIEKMLDSKIQIVSKGIKDLNNGVGMEVLTHVEKAIKHRKFANFWALVGTIFRVGNGLWGVASKIVFFVLGSVLAPWIAPLVSAVVLLAYALKSWMHTRYTRLATRLDNLLVNTIKVLSQTGSKQFKKYLDPKLVTDLEALARGGKHLQHFLKALGRSDLWAGVADVLKSKSSIEERFPMIKRVIDICTTPIEMVHRALEKSQSAFDAQAATLIPKSRFENNENLEISSAHEHELKDEPPLDHPISHKEFSAGEEKIFQKLMSSKLEKAIVSRIGEFAGWRFSSGKKEDVKAISDESIKARVGGTHETNLTLSILDGLNKNNKTRNGKLSTFFNILIKNRTWSLTRYAKDCEKALENQDPTRLSTTTLAAALTADNAQIIAQCRFKGSEEEQIALAKQLAGANPSKIKTIAKAIDQCDGKKLSSELKALGQNFQPSLKVALMLFGHTNAAADRIVKVLSTAQNSKPPAEDLSAALGILTQQRLYAKFKNDALYASVRRYLVDENQSFAMPGENSLLISTNSPADPRRPRYIEDIVKRKIPIGDVPDFLLSRELRETLKSKPANTAEALREQLLLGFQYQSQRQARVPMALNWPTPGFYGKTKQAQSDTLKHSFSEMLKIDASASATLDVLEAAAFYREWNENKTLLELKSTIKSGGIRASVALHCITNLTGIPLLDQSSIDRFDTVKDIDQIKSICLDLINLKRLEQNKLRIEEDRLDKKEDHFEKDLPNSSLDSTLVPNKDTLTQNATHRPGQVPSSSIDPMNQSEEDETHAPDDEDAIAHPVIWKEASESAMYLQQITAARQLVRINAS